MQRLKSFIFICSLFVLVWVCTHGLKAQGVAIANQHQNADPSAILDVSSSTKGILIPRINTLQRDQIVQPAKALLIFNTTSNQFEANTGTKEVPEWMALVTQLTLDSNTGFLKWGGNVLQNQDGTIGSKNRVPLKLITNDSLRLFIDTTQGRIGVNTSFPQSSLHIKATDAVILPSGSTAERPTTPVPGMIRYNKESGKLEGYTLTGWKNLQ